jgi:hypothetical protein
MCTRRLAITASVVLFMASTATPTDRVVVNSFVTAVKQDCPIQILGFRLPDRSGEPPKVLLHNTTASEVIFFYLYALIGDPRGVDGSGPKLASGLGQKSKWVHPEPKIPPHGDAEFEAKFLRPFLAAFQAKDVRSNCLHVAVIVTNVELADGTAWASNSKHDELLWRESIRLESSTSCDNSPAIGETLGQLKGSGPASLAPARLNPETVQFYSVACPVRTTSGGLVAMCDW